MKDRMWWQISFLGFSISADLDRLTVSLVRCQDDQTKEDTFFGESKSLDRIRKATGEIDPDQCLGSMTGTRDHQEICDICWTQMKKAMHCIAMIVKVQWYTLNDTFQLETIHSHYKLKLVNINSKFSRFYFWDYTLTFEGFP